MHRVRRVHHGRRYEGCVQSDLFFGCPYTRQGDAPGLLMALAACLLGYGEVGLWLMQEAKQPQSWVRIEGNPYMKWIEDYSGEDYQAAVKVGIGASCRYVAVAGMWLMA